MTSISNHSHHSAKKKREWFNRSRAIEAIAHESFESTSEVMLVHVDVVSFDELGAERGSKGAR